MRVAAMGLMLASALAITAVPAGANAERAGSDGVGDRFFPQAGNGGYDVRAYDLDLQWYPGIATLDGVARIDAVATAQLDRFNLDLRALSVRSVMVNGVPARFRIEGQELIVTPVARVTAGTAFTAVVAYAGQPQPVIDPDGSSEGWMAWDRGIVALGEPQGSPSWFPSNDHPSDKATFALSITVPNGQTTASVGNLVSTTRNGTRTTYRWVHDKPMPTYLTTLSIGKLRLTRTTTSWGMTVINAITPSLAAASAPSVARLPEMLVWLRGYFGPYPFTSTGVIVVDAPDVGYALETQDRPTFTYEVDDYTLVHELAHQWAGNSVSPEQWSDIWLNESFATYAEWLWSEREGEGTAQQVFDYFYDLIPANHPFWQLPIGPDTLPGPAEMFHDPVYIRGAMALHAVRVAIGDADFFTLVQRWPNAYRFGNASTADLLAMAEQISGEQLDDVLALWLDTPGKPDLGLRVASRLSEPAPFSQLPELLASL